MRTTLNLDEALIRDLMQVAEGKTKTEAIHEAIREYVRQRKIDRLRALRGKVLLSEDWQEREEEELRLQAERERLLYGDR